MKKGIIFLIILVSVLDVYAQEKSRLNNVVLEVGGSSIPYTLGYEGVFNNKSPNSLRFKIGFGLSKTLDCIDCDTDNTQGRKRRLESIISWEILNLRGRGRSKFEYGVGLGVTFVFDSSILILVSGRIGYRFISKASGFNFGIGLNPSFKLVGESVTRKFLPIPGIKLGYAF